MNVFAEVRAEDPDIDPIAVEVRETTEGDGRFVSIYPDCSEPLMLAVDEGILCVELIDIDGEERKIALADVRSS